jgi:hypothetical protein
MSLPSGQVLARLVDPITSTSAQSVFVISPEGDSMLRGTDVLLHAAFVATPDANGARWHPALGGWAAVKQFQITDMRGQTLFILREAARWMHYKLTTMPQSQATDLENELSLVNRAITTNAALVYTTAQFRSAPDGYAVVADSTATPRFTLNLSRMCDLFARGMLPLHRTGPLRIAITWETAAANMFCRATDNTLTAAVTGIAPVYAQLSYSLLSSPALAAALPKEINFLFQQPELVSASVDASIDRKTYSLGLNSQRVSSVVLGVNDSALAYINAKGCGRIGLNAVVNGRSLFPVDIDGGSVLGETEAAVGPLGIQAGGYHQPLTFGTGPTNISADDVLHNAGKSTCAWMALDLRTIKSAPQPNPANALGIDQAGFTLAFQKNETISGTLYGWGIVERQLMIGQPQQGVLQVL